MFVTFNSVKSCGFFDLCLALYKPRFVLPSTIGVLLWDTHSLLYLGMQRCRIEYGIRGFRCGIAKLAPVVTTLRNVNDGLRPQGLISKVSLKNPPAHPVLRSPHHSRDETSNPDTPSSPVTCLRFIVFNQQTLHQQKS
jgi:hypothetical protein